MQIIVTQQHDDRALLKLSGRLEGGAYAELKRACARLLLMPAVRNIRLDLQDVESLGSGAIGALLVLSEQAGAAGRGFRLLGGREEVRQTLESAGLRVSLWVA